MSEEESIFNAANGGGSTPGGGGAMKQIKKDVEKCVEKWGAGIKVTKGPKGSPFPVIVQRTIARPEGAAEFWDVEKMVAFLQKQDIWI